MLRFREKIQIIAPLIYNFLIYYISFANLKNFGVLRLHREIDSYNSF
jgi:hypothetical protein